MRVRKGLLLGLVVGAIGMLLRPLGIGLRLEEEVGLPALFALRGPVAPPTDVVIVSLDKRSAQQLELSTEQWPPPRDVHASVIRSLNRRHASTIVMDIWFESSHAPQGDEDLARAMAERGNVVLVQRIDRRGVRGSSVSVDSLQSPIIRFQESVIALAPFPLPRSSLTSVFWPFYDTSAGTVATLPAAALQAHALPQLDRLRLALDRARIGHLDELPQHVTSVADSEQLMRVLRRTLRNDPVAAGRALAEIEVAQAGGPSATQTRVLAALLRLYSGPDTYYVNFYGPAGSIRTIPFHELLRNGPGAPADLSGTVVFVGASTSTLVTSAEQPDTYPTVYSTADGVNLSGAEIGATALANLLTDRTLQPLGPLPSIAVLFAFGGLIGLLARALPGMRAAISTILLGSAGIVVAEYLFRAHGILVPLAVPLLVQLPVGLFVGVLARYLDLRRQVPLEVDPRAPQQLFSGVCLATDVRGYTTLTEHLTRDQLHLLLDDYHRMLRRLVDRRQGLVWGRGGDSVLCVWKAPVGGAWLPTAWLGWTGRQNAAKKTRLKACVAAIEIRDAIDRFNARHQAAEQLFTRIGLDAGEIGLGPVGGELQAIGNPVNAAARIEELNKELGTKLLASQRVVQDQDTLVVRRLGLFVLRGSSAEIGIFEILGQHGAVEGSQQRLCERFAAGLVLFETRQWPEAFTHFQQLALDYPADGPAPYYRDLCERYAAAPPPGGRAVIDPAAREALAPPRVH